jgi:metal-responsive CopG/Arc/MetJ family transcriptional regulator
VRPSQRPSHTFTISLPPDLADEVDRLAKEEHRSRSELFREAFRRYVNSRHRWERILEFGPQAATASGLDTEAEIDAAVDEAVHDVRLQRRRG